MEQHTLIHRGVIVDNMDGILPRSQHQHALFLGNLEALLDEKALKRFNIKAAVSAMPLNGVNIPSCIDAHLIVPVLDQDNQPIYNYFQKVFEFIQRARRYSNVLIHCQAGISRSVTLTIAYMMRRFGWTVKKSYSYVKERRVVACPNLGFCNQLITYEKDISVSDDWQIVDGQPQLIVKDQSTMDRSSSLRLSNSSGMLNSMLSL